MTVIAGKVYKDKIVLGADTQETWGQAVNICNKIYKVSDDFVIGASGNAYEAQLMTIFTKTHKPKSNIEDDIVDFMVEFHDWCRKKNTEFKPTNWFLIIFKDKLLSITSSLDVTYHDYWAVGSGWEYARAALHLGHDVKEAIKVACDLTIYCGEPIEIIEVMK